MTFGQSRFVSTATTTDFVGRVVTADTTAHTKGGWTQLLTATAFEGRILHVIVQATALSNTLTSMLLDIGIDAAGGTAYTVAVPNILCGAATGQAGFHRNFTVPVYIPTGSTVAARIQALVSGGDTAVVGVAVMGGVDSTNPANPGLVVDYGTNESDSTGVPMLNAGVDTFGAWAEIISATTHPHVGIAISYQAATSTTSNNIECIVDIGIGAGGSEVVLVSNLYLGWANGESIGAQFPPGVLLENPIPEGSRLSARAAADQANKQDELDVALYGWG